MQPVKTINPPVWMTDYKTVKLMQTIGGFEAPAQSLFVGGCVRNLLLDRPVQDIDIATIHPPLQVIEKLTAAGIRYVPTGLDHGTVTAIIEDTAFEITTLRKDIETDGRHAVIAFTKEWAEDAARRDFTMNTLLASSRGEIFDPTGKGVEDLEARRVVFVGKADERIAEDYLRILRFFRFFAQYGEGEMDAEALKACQTHGAKLSSLSRERITQEFLKILAVPHAADILDVMFGQGILPDIGRAFDRKVLAYLCALQERFEARDTMARLFVLSGMTPNYFEKWLVLSNAQKKMLERMALGLKILKSVSKKAVRELVYRVGNADALQIYCLKICKKEEWPDLEIVDLARYWQAPIFPVKAEQLIAGGISPGPALGKKLKELEEKWIKSDFSKIQKI